MCTALVVREDYWRGYFKNEMLLRTGYIDHNKLDNFVRWSCLLMDNIADYIRRICKAIIAAAQKVVVFVHDKFEDLAEALKTFYDASDIYPTDDFYIICDKLENRMIYLERKASIRREQYYKNCFKLAKMNYALINHDRKC